MTANQQAIAAAYARYISGELTAVQYGDEVHQLGVAALLDADAAPPKATPLRDGVVVGQAPPAPPAQARQGGRGAPLAPMAEAMVVVDLDHFAIHTPRAIYHQRHDGKWMQRRRYGHHTHQPTPLGTPEPADPTMVPELMGLAATHGKLILWHHHPEQDQP